MNFFTSIFRSFTIWVLSALLNALFSGSWLYFFSTEFNKWPQAFILAFIFTLIFSIPGIFIFWVVLLINRNQDGLFRSLLKAGFIISALSSMLLFILPVNVVGGNQVFLSLFIVVATIAAIMVHHSSIQSFSANKITENHA